MTLAATEPGVGPQAAKVVANTGFTGRGVMNRFATAQREAVQDAIGGVAEQSKNSVLSALDEASPRVAQEALKTADSFADAAAQIKAAAKSRFAAIDDVTNGEFSQLQTDRTDAIRLIKKANTYDQLTEARRRLAQTEMQENALFDIFKDRQPEVNKSTVDAARQAWKRASAMEELQARIDSVTRGFSKDTELTKTASGKDIAAPRERVLGASLINKLEDMDDSRLLDAVGGNARHARDLKTIAGLLANDAQSKATWKKIGSEVGVMIGGLGVHGLAKFFPVAGWSLAGVEGVSGLLSLLMTSPRAARVLANGLRTATSPKAIASAVVAGMNQDKGSDAQITEQQPTASDVLSGNNP